MIQRWLKRIAFTLLGLVLLMGLYLAVACALMFWPAHARPSTETPTVQAWVLSNGVHTDLVFPIHSASIDWRQLSTRGLSGRAAGRRVHRHRLG